MDVKGRTGQRKLKSNESKMKEHARLPGHIGTRQQPLLELHLCILGVQFLGEGRRQ